MKKKLQGARPGPILKDTQKRQSKEKVMEMPTFYHEDTVNSLGVKKTKAMLEYAVQRSK